MGILAIETSSKVLCVGMMDSKGRIAEYQLDATKRHTKLLLPTIKKALKRLGLGLEELDYLAVGLGPGSFTGLRIGLATIKGFAAALGTACVGVPSLDVLAQGGLPAEARFVCPVVDAKRSLLFTALYKRSRNGSLRRVSRYLLISVEELLKRIEPAEPIAFLGDGLCLYQEQLRRRVKKGIFLSEKFWYPQAKNLIKLAKDLIARGKISDATKLKPLYLYPKECQIKK